MATVTPPATVTEELLPSPPVSQPAQLVSQEVSAEQEAISKIGQKAVHRLKGTGGYTATGKAGRWIWPALGWIGNNILVFCIVIAVIAIMAAVMYLVRSDTETCTDSKIHEWSRGIEITSYVLLGVVPIALPLIMGWSARSDLNLP